MEYQSTLETTRVPRAKASGRSLSHTMRILHRDIGFLLIGLTLVFSLSGILLVYRSTPFMKSETQVTRTLASGLSGDELGAALHLRKLRISGDDGRYIEFNSDAALSAGRYDRESGEASYTAQQLPTVLEKFNALHKTGSATPLHWFSALYGVLLCFLAVSSFWMFKPSTRQFRRGVVFSAIGMVAAGALVAAV